MYITITYSDNKNISKDFEVDSKQKIIDFIKKVNEEFDYVAKEEERTISFVKSKFLCKNISTYCTFQDANIKTGDMLILV